MEGHSKKRLQLENPIYENSEVVELEYGNMKETVQIHHFLKNLNDLGFMTFSSQPWSSLENQRGIWPLQIEYVAGLLDSDVYENLERRLEESHPNIIWSTPEIPVFVPVSRDKNGSVKMRGWGGRMSEETYLEKLTPQKLKNMKCVQIIHFDWTCRKDYLFLVLIDILKELKQ